MSGRFDKARNIALIVWLEELENAERTYGDLLAFLDGLKVPCVCSPLHDKDVYTSEDVRKWYRRHIDPDTGEPTAEDAARMPRVGDSKKHHVHIMIRFSGPRTPSYCSKLFSDFLLVPEHRWEKVESPDSMLRYFAHLDTPDKPTYNALSVVGFGGIDMSALLKTDSNTRIQVLMDLMARVQELHIHSYAVLVRWVMETGDMEYINCVCGRASYWTGYFRSLADDKAAENARRKRESENQVDY